MKLPAWCCLACLTACGCPQAPPQAPTGGTTPQIDSTAGSDDEVPPRPKGVLPTFRAVGAASGLDFQRFDDIGPTRRILEVNGGGVALIDIDQDGLSDVFFTNGCRLPIDPSDRATPGVLYRNFGEMHFEAISAKARIAQFGFGAGCAAADYNSDGFVDLYLTAFGRNWLYRNNGDGTFENVTASAGVAVPLWSTSAAFGDLNGDGHADLYVVNYLDESDSSPRLCPNPESPDGYDGCSPAIFEGVDDVLLISDGTGRFHDVSHAAGIDGRLGKGLGVVISNLDRSGPPEIYVANDGQANFLFCVDEASADLRYVERAPRSGVALNEHGYAQAGMGVAAGDVDGNGTFDLFLTHFYGDTNTLYLNHGGLAFEDATRGCGLAPVSRRRLGFGTSFWDADNDGRLDVIIANGHVDDRSWRDAPEPYRMQPELYRGAGDGTFEDVSFWGGDYFQQEWLGRGLAVGDLDRDGRVDAVISHQLAPSVALHNQTDTDAAGLTLRLVGTQSQRNGIGAVVELIDHQAHVVRELVGGGSFQSASALEVHLGLGPAASADVRVIWPSGRESIHREMTAGNWTIVESGGAHRVGD